MILEKSSEALARRMADPDDEKQNSIVRRKPIEARFSKILQMLKRSERFQASGNPSGISRQCLP